MTQRRITAQLGAIALTVLLCLGLVGGWATPAQAAIRQFEEAPGQMLFQTRQTLQDSAGNRWQAIAFKRHKTEGDDVLYLRLVGFPGAINIDRSRPLRLVDSLGKTLTAADTSAQMFTDARSPEPHIGQYDLGAVLPEINPAVPLELQIPVTDGNPVELLIAPPTLQEWKQLPRFPKTETAR